MSEMKRTQISECKSVSEALAMASLDWRSIPQDIFLGDGTRIPDKKAIVRSDTLEALGVVGKQYEPISNYDTFSFFDSLVQNQVVEFDSAGFYGSGKNVFLQGKVLDGAIETAPGDTSDLYIMAWNSHDGSSRLKFFVSAMRFVCMNMFRLLQSDASTFLHARHTKNSIERWVLDVENTEKMLNDTRANYTENVRKLQSAPMGLFEFSEFAKMIVGDNDKKLAQLNHNFVAGQGSEFTRYTMWGALNAVTEYTTHEQSVRAQDKDTARFFSSIVGAGNSHNSKAYNLLLNAA